MGGVGILLLALLFGAILVDGAVAGLDLLLGLVAGSLAAWAATRSRLRAASPAALGVVAVWCALALAQTAWADASDSALDGAAAVWTVAACFLVAATSIARDERERWLVAFGLGGAVVAAVALEATAPGTRAGAPFGNPNRLASFLLLPMAVAYTGLCVCGPHRRTGGWTILWFGVLAVCGAALAATRSLGAGLACAAAVVAVGWLARGPTRKAAALVVVGLAAVALGLAIAPPLAPQWLPWAGEGGESSIGIRWALYAAAARTAVDAGIWGTGIGGFESAFALRRPLELTYAPRHAHNEILHGIVELGLPLLGLVLGSIALALRRARAIVAPRRSLAGWTGIAAVLAIASHALVDAPLHVPAVATGLAALLGLAWNAAERRPGWVWATRGVLVSLCLGLFALAGSGGIAVLAEQRAERALEQGGFEAAERFARQGLALRPTRLSLLRIASRSASLDWELGGGGRAALERALAIRGEAIASDPGRSAVHVERAKLRLRAGDRAGALLDLEQAALRDPTAPGPHLARARVLLQDGRPREAAAAARRALVLHPRATPRVVAEWVRADADPALVTTLVPEQASAWVRAGRALERAGYSRVAADAFQRALSLDPGDARTAVETARSWRRAGLADRAESVLSQALDQAPADTTLRAEWARTVGGSS